MHNVAKMNGIEKTAKYRLIDSGVLHKDMHADEAYFRLRYHYGYVGSVVFSAYGKRLDEFLMIKSSELAETFARRKLILSVSTASGLSGASQLDIKKILRGARVEPVVIPSGNLMYGLKGEFYKSEDMVEVFKQLSRGRYKLCNENRPPMDKMVRGMTLLHPRGEEGVKSMQELFSAACTELHNPVPTVALVNYEAIDFAHIDWLRAMGHASFKHATILKDCPDNSFLIKYANTPRESRTAEFLANLAKEAAKRSRIKKSDVAFEEAKKPAKTYATLHQLIHDKAAETPDTWINVCEAYQTLKHLHPSENTTVARTQAFMHQMQVFKQHIANSWLLYASYIDVAKIVGMEKDDFGQDFWAYYVSHEPENASETVCTSVPLPVGEGGKNFYVLTGSENIIKMLTQFLLYCERKGL